jgi:hypothetical protein
MPIVSSTFLFVGVTNKGIYLGADSRATTGQHVTDNATKIGKCGSRGAFAICGTCSAENHSEARHLGKWSLYQILEGCHGLPAGGATGRATFIARQLYHSSVAFFDGYSEKIEALQCVRSGEWASPAIFTVLYCEWSKDGTASVVRIRFPMTARRAEDAGWLNSLKGPVVETLYLAPQGNVFFCHEPTGRIPVFPSEPPPSSDASGVVHWFTDLFRLTAEQVPEASATIGGPTDVALVDGSGFRWLSHK